MLDPPKLISTMQNSSQTWLYSSQSSSSSYTLPTDIGSSQQSQLQFQPSNLNAPLHGSDPNSPEVFKHNIQIAQNHVMRIQSLAQSALTEIKHAYHPGSNPLQAAADITTLRQSLLLLIDTLRQSGVGALPLHPPQPGLDISEDQLIAETTRAVQAEFDRWKRIQDSGSIVTSLLGNFDGPSGNVGSQSQSSSQGRR